MKNWLFLDIDEVISTFRHSLSIGEEGGIRQSWDDTALRLIERAIEGHDVHLVISSAWRYCQADWEVRYFANRFRAEGFMEMYRALNRTFELFGGYTNPEEDKRAPGWSTGPRLNTREMEVDSYINNFCRGDCVVVLDDADLQLKTTTGFVHVITPMDGLSTENYIKMREIYDAAVSNVNPIV